MRLIRRLTGCLCFLFGLGVMVEVLTCVTRDKTDGALFRPFYDAPAGSVDVVFAGSSHTMCAIDPAVLLDKFGISAYDCASPAMPPAPIYYLTAEALRVQTPEVVALDVSGAMYEIRTGGPEFLHVQLDNMKWSRNKIAAIRDLVEEPEERWEYYFPIIRFHSRWKTLTTEDFGPIQGDTRGARIRDGVYVPDRIPETVPPDYMVPIPGDAEKYIRKTIALCQDAGIRVILFNTPDLADALFQGRRNAVARIAEEYGVPYLNLMYHLDEMDFDWNTDLFDDGHCNRAGAEKVSCYIGRFLENDVLGLV